MRDRENRSLRDKTKRPRRRAGGDRQQTNMPGSTTLMWKSDDELFALVQRELFTCVVGDVMDKLGLQHQFLPPQIQALRQDMVVIGRAMPVLAVDVFAEKIAGSANKLMDKPFGLMLEALDDLHHNEIYVNTGSSPRNALWGELMSTRARRLGSRGAVLNGYVRDTKAILNMGFPTFGFGSYGQDSAPRYKVVDYRIPVELGAVRVRPGDILFGDIDGVLLVPAEAEAEVFSRALEKARGEKLVKKAIEEGSSAVDAFDKFGIM
jgi:regulator of RNase E activity RraA